MLLQLRTAGIGESSLAQKVDSILADKPGLVVGYCAHAGMVDLRLSSLDSDLLNEEQLNELGDQNRMEIGEILFAMEIVPLPKLSFANYAPLIKHWRWPSPAPEGYCLHLLRKSPESQKIFHGGAVCYHNDLPRSKF